MNKIYRLVWNKYLALWTVVSEIARGATKKRNVTASTVTVQRSSLSLYIKHHIKPTLLATVIGSIFYSSNAFAGYELNGGSTFTNCTSASTGSGTESTNSLAFGPTACAPTNDSIAIGRAASTQSVGGVSNQSISIGAFSRAGGDQSVALGANTRATGNSSVAIGGDDVDRLANNAALRTKYNQITGGTIVAGQYPTTTAMQGSTAVGVQATATGDFSSAYGMTSRATGDASAAFGVQANAAGRGAVAFGAVAQATGNGSAALGVNATASATESTALGSGNTKATAARATAVSATAIGNRSLASGVGSAAIGRGTQATGDRSIALGDGAQSTANGTAALGVNANASADKAIAIGSGETPDTAAKASAVDATAIGNRSVSSGVGSAAIGRAAQATGDKSLALGDAAQAVTGGDMAVGDAAYARSGTGNISAIALGRTSRADGNNTLAIGNAAQATDNFAAAIGNAAQATADNAIAVGNSAKASGNLSSALGNNANASGLESSAIGNGAVASGEYALATGSQAQALASETVAIGHSAQAQGLGDISIGSNAATATGGTNNIAMGNGVSTGAAGQNVAIGSGSTTANSSTPNGGAVSIGRGQQATGDGAVAIGDPNIARGDGAVALGKDNTAAGDTAGNTAANGAVALGNGNQAIGQGSLALGNISTASAAGAIALGDTAKANGASSVAIGTTSETVQNGDIAIGQGSYAAGKVIDGVAQSSAALGLNARADGADALAVGNTAKATADYAAALGNYAEATGVQSTAVGNVAKATGRFAIAQGNNTLASGEFSTSVGNFTRATGESAVAIGDLAEATANDTIAIGTVAQATGQESIAIGYEADSSGVQANALGYNAEATGTGSSAMGTFANASGSGASALGAQSTASGARSSAVGARAIASGDNSTASGVDAKATGASTVATGDNAQAQSDNDIAIGRNAATASGTDGDNIAVGNGVTTGATGKNVAIGSDGTTANTETAEGGAVAIGRDQVANGDGAVAIGDPNRASGSGAVALGKDNTAAGDTAATSMANGAVAIGNTNQAIGQGSVAIGNTSVAAAAGGIALGDTANAQAERGVALGSNAVATNADDVALGSGSVTSAANPTANGTVGGVNYNYAGTTPSSVVSVGSEGNERQITNVAAGRVSETSTDAINGSQLYSTQQALGNLAESTANHLGGGSVVNPDGTISAPSYIVNETPINNVGDAITELDKGWNLQSNGAKAGAIKATDTVDIGTVEGEENLTVTKDGNTIQYGLNKDLKVDSVTAGDTVINDNGVTIANGPSITKSGINAAGNPITNVGAGVNDTDAVNKGQLDDAAAAAKTEVTQGKNITVTKTTGTDGQDIYNVTTKDTVDFNNVTVGDVNIDGATGKISGVTAGEVSATSDEAINGSQLAGTAKSVSDALGGGSVVNPDGTVTAPSYTVNGETVTNVGDAIGELDKGWNLQSNGAKAGAIKATDTVDIGTVEGEDNLTVTKDGNTIQYGLNKDLKVDSVTAGDTVINDNGVTITNGPSITKSGINAAGNPISNVGAGVNDTDAVNKGQLDDAAAASKTEVTQGKNITVTKTVGTDGQDIYNVVTKDTVDFNNVTVGDVNIDGATGKISGVTAGEVSATSDEAINGSQLAGTAKSVSDALGGGSVVNPDGTVTAPSYTVNGVESNNVGDAITALDKGWNLQSNGAKAGAIKATDTVDIGTVEGEENLTVTKDGNTIQYGLNKDLKVDSVTAGDTVINDNGVTITNGPSITKSGINAAGNPITNVGAGVNDTDAVNKGQLDDAAAAAKTEVTQGKNITVTKTTGTDGQDIYNVATKDTVDFNNVTVGDVNIDGATGKISGVTAGEVSATSDEAINGSQLAGTAKSVSDALGGGSVVNPDGTVTAPSYTVNGVESNNVGDAITALDKGWNLQSNGANAGAIKATDTVDIGTAEGEENLTVTKDGNTIQYGLNKDLKVDSVTAGDTVINDNGVTIANGPSVTKSGINAAGNPITNVGAGVNDTDAVNKGQLDDAAAASKTEVTQGKNITVTKTTGTDGQDIYNVATKDTVDFNNVTVGDVNIDGATGKISGVTAGEVSATSDEAINGSQLAGTAKSVSDALGGGSVVNPDGTVTAPSYTVNGVESNNVGDAITELDKGWNLQSNGANAGAIKATDTVDIGTVEGEENLTVTKDGNTIQYGLNKDLKVDSVTAGDTVMNSDGVTIANGPSITKSGINAAGNPISNVGAGVNDTDAVNKGQLDDAAAAAKTEVTQGKNITVTKTTGTDGQDIYNVATKDTVDFNNVTVGDVNIDGATGKISGVTAGEVSATSDEAINGSQLAGTAKSVSDALGGGSVVNPDGTVTAPSYTVNGVESNNVGDAITELDKGWNLQSNGANAGAIKATDTVDIGTVEGEENLTVTKDGNTIQYGLNKDLRVDSVTAGDTRLDRSGVAVTDAVGNRTSIVAGGTIVQDAQGNSTATTASGTTIKNAQGDTTLINSAGLGFTDAAGNPAGPRVNRTGIDAGNSKVTNVADGTIAVGSKDAVNGGQLHGVADSVRGSIGGETTLNPDGSITTSNVGNTGKNNIHDAIDSIRGTAVAAKTEVEAGKNMTVESRVGDDGQTIYEVATADDVSFDSVQVGDVNIDGATGKISGVAAGEVSSTSDEAINGSQLAGTARSVSDALGGGSVVNPDGTVTAPSYTVNGETVTNVGDAIGELDKGWNLQSNGANAGAIKATDTVDIGTVEGEENLTVTKDGNTIQYGLNKELKVDSVTAGDTVINTDGVTIANGPSVTKSGIDAAGNPMTNVGAGVNDTDAVNKGQLDSAAAAAKTEVEAGKNMTVESRTGADGQTIYEVATADDVSFDSVQVGDVNIDGATGKISGVADGTIATGSSEAVNGGQLHGVADSVKNSIGGETTLNPDGSITTANVGNTGQNNIHDAIDSIRGAAVAAKTTVTEGNNMVVTQSTNPDGSTNYEVATARDVDFDSVQIGDVNIDGATGKISGVAAGEVSSTSDEAINGSQLAGTAKSVSDALGGGSVVNPDGTVTAPSYTVNGETVTNVGDAIGELDKGWNLQSNGANAGAIRATDTVDIGTVEGEENLTVTKDGNTIQYGLNKDLKVDSVTAGDTVINTDGVTIANGPSVTKSGIDAAGNKISNIADGSISAGSKDAVNGGQLNDSMTSTGDILGGGVTNEGGKLNGPFTVNDKGYDTVADAIQGETAAAKTEVEAGKNMTVGSRTGADGQTIYEVATADDVSFDSVQVGDVNIDGATGKISGVADGTIAAGSKDAVNGGQLHGIADSVKNSIGGETALNPDGSITTSNVGNTGKGNIHDAIDSVRGAAVAAKTTVTEGNNMVVTQSTNPDGSTNYDVATAKEVKFDSVTATDAEGNETILTATGTQVKDGEGNNAEYGAKGINLKDQDGNTTIINPNGLGFVDPAGNNIGPNITVNGIDAGNTVITGVAPGRVAADSTDAINGSQLKGVADSVAGAIGGNTKVNTDGSISTSNIGGTGQNNINDAIGAVGKAAQQAKTTVSKAAGDENVMVNRSSNDDGSTDYEIGLAKDINVDSVTAGDTRLDGNGLSIAGGPSVTKDGIDAGDNKVTGVADGSVAAGSKDAINGGQLHGVADSVKNVVGGKATVNPDGSITTSDIGGTGANNINDAISSVRGAAAAAKSTVSNKDGNILVSPTTKADGSKDYEVGLAKDINVDSVTAANQVNVGGTEGTTIAADGVRIAEGPSITKGGIDAGNRKITAVADGAIASDSKDAINGSQLHKSYENVGKALGGGAGYDPSTGWTPPNYEVGGGKHDNVGDALNALNNADQALGDRITNLGDQMQQAFYDTNQRIDDVKKMANAGVAAAMALETAPYISGKYTYAVGAAYHGGENAVGVTLRKTADNGRWSLTTGVAAASQGDPSFRVGLSGVFD